MPITLLTDALLGALPALAAEPPPATTGPVDGLQSSSGSFTQLLENDQARVLRYRLPPGATNHRHMHPAPVGYVLSGTRVRVTLLNGSHMDHDKKTGDHFWADGTLPAQHAQPDSKTL